MSWDVDLIDDRGHCEGSWNYTHNTSRMIYAVLEDAGVDLGTWAEERPGWNYSNGEPVRRTWWDHLNGMSGPDGAAYLHTIAEALADDPERFRAMNPENGWGNYDTLLDLLREMARSVPEWPCKWEANG